MANIVSHINTLYQLFLFWVILLICVNKSESVSHDFIPYLSNKIGTTNKLGTVLVELNKTKTKDRTNWNAKNILNHFD